MPVITAITASAGKRLLFFVFFFTFNGNYINHIQLIEFIEVGLCVYEIRIDMLQIQFVSKCFSANQLSRQQKHIPAQGTRVLSSR